MDLKIEKGNEQTGIGNSIWSWGAYWDVALWSQSLVSIHPESHKPNKTTHGNSLALWSQSPIAEMKNCSKLRDLKHVQVVPKNVKDPCSDWEWQVDSMNWTLNVAKWSEEDASLLFSKILISELRRGWTGTIHPARIETARVGRVGARVMSEYVLVISKKRKCNCRSATRIHRNSVFPSWLCKLLPTSELISEVLFVCFYHIEEREWAINEWFNVCLNFEWKWRKRKLGPQLESQ